MKLGALLVGISLGLSGAACSATDDVASSIAVETSLRPSELRVVKAEVITDAIDSFGAAHVAIGSGTFEHTIRGDAAYYRVTVPPRAVLSASLEELEGDLDLEITDVDHVRITQSISLGLAAEHVVIEAGSAGGTAFVVVRARPESDKDRKHYTLVLRVGASDDTLPGAPAGLSEKERAPIASFDVAETKGVRLPAEFEPADELYVGWPSKDIAPTATLAPFLADVVRAARPAGKVTILGQPSDVRSALARASIPATSVSILEKPVFSVWMRDYGPYVVETPDGARATDARYGLGARADDDSVPDAIAKARKIPRVDVPLDVEGGNLLFDGRGKCIVTTHSLEENPGVGEDAFRKILAASYGCTRVTIVPRLKYGVETTGHADVFLLVTAPGRVLVGEYRGSVDLSLARFYDEAAALLAREGWSVGRIPMPPLDHRNGATYGKASERFGARDLGTFSTYTNALAFEGLVLVPVYADKRYEEEALAILRTEYGGRTIVPIDANVVIVKEGAVHCTTMTVAAPSAAGPHLCPAECGAGNVCSRMAGDQGFCCRRTFPVIGDACVTDADCKGPGEICAKATEDLTLPKQFGCIVPASHPCVDL